MVDEGRPIKPGSLSAPIDTLNTGAPQTRRYEEDWDRKERSWEKVDLLVVGLYRERSRSEDQESFSPTRMKRSF